MPASSGCSGVWRMLDTGTRTCPPRGTATRRDSGSSCPPGHHRDDGPRVGVALVGDDDRLVGPAAGRAGALGAVPGRGHGVGPGDGRHGRGDRVAGARRRRHVGTGDGQHGRDRYARADDDQHRETSPLAMRECRRLRARDAGRSRVRPPDPRRTLASCGATAPRDDDERQHQQHLERDQPVATKLTVVVDRHRPAFGRGEAVRPTERLHVTERLPSDGRAPVAVERLAPQHQSGTGRARSRRATRGPR